MAKEKYPLEQVLSVKKDRVEKAERLVEEKKTALETELAKLKKVEAMRDEMKKHKEDKLQQMNEAFKKGTNSDEILVMKRYLEVVHDKLVSEEKKVIGQQQQVQVAKNKLKEAQDELSTKRKEEEKIVLHRQHWEKEQKKEQELKETVEQDELGQLMHQARQRRLGE